MAASSRTKMYNWNTLPRETVRKGVERVGFRGESTLLVMNFVQPRLDVRPHSHTFEQIVVCVRGRMNYHVGDEVFEMEAGSMLRVPAGVIHFAEVVGDGEALNLDVFSAIRSDYEHLVEHQRAEFEANDQVG